LFGGKINFWGAIAPRPPVAVAASLVRGNDKRRANKGPPERLRCRRVETEVRKIPAEDVHGRRKKHFSSVLSCIDQRPAHCTVDRTGR